MSQLRLEGIFRGDVPGVFCPIVSWSRWTAVTGNPELKTILARHAPTCALRSDDTDAVSHEFGYFGRSERGKLSLYDKITLDDHGVMVPNAARFGYGPGPGPGEDSG